MITDKQITKMVLKYKLENKISYEDLAPMLGMAKMTILKRVKLHNWSLTEKFFIEKKLGN